MRQKKDKVEISRKLHLFTTGIMNKLFTFALISSSFYAIPSWGDVTVSSGTKIYYSDQVPITNFIDSSGIGLGNGYSFTSDYDCSSNITSNSLNGGIITNQACINEIIKSGSNSTIEIAPNVNNASIEIGSGSNPTTINNEGLSINGENLIKKSSDGVTSIGKNSLKLQESGGLQKMWATDASGNSIPIDIKNGTKLLINGRDVEQSINNVGAISAALTGLPTVPTDTTLACGLGTGTHGGDFAFAGGCASKVNDKLSINYAASMTMPGQDYAGDFEDQFSARAGFVWKLGKSVKSSLISIKDKQKITNEITDLKSENKNLNKKITKFETEKLELLARLERLEKIAISETNSKDLATIKLP